MPSPGPSPGSPLQTTPAPAPGPRPSPAPAPGPRPSPAPAPGPRPSPAPAPVSVPPGTRTTTLPARFRIKTPTGKYLRNKLWSSTASNPTLSLDQTATIVNFSVITSGLYSLPANYVALKDADVSASNSGHYNSTTSTNYVGRGTFWSSAQGGGPGWAWQFYRQSDGTFIIVNNKNGVNNYLFELSSSDWPQVTTNLASATKFTIEDASTPAAPAPTPRAPAPTPRAPAPTPAALAPTPAPEKGGVSWWVWVLVSCLILILVGIGFMMMKKPSNVNVAPIAPPIAPPVAPPVAKPNLANLI